MKHLSREESRSLWLDYDQSPESTPLSENLTVDVCVVGGGLGGLTTAYLLGKEGKSVCVLEDRDLGAGQSGRTTAQATYALDYRYFELEKLHGREGARLAAESHARAIETIAQIAAAEHIECDLKRVDGYLFSPLSETSDELDRELAALQRAGMKDVTLILKAPFEHFETGAALHYPNQLQFHPLKYLDGLAHAILKQGGKIFTGTHVTDVKGGDTAVIKTKNGREVRAKSVVVATHTPVNDLFAIHTKQAPYRTYVLGFKIPKDSVIQGLFWDTQDPYHYIRTQSFAEYDILLIGGEDHKTGQEDNPEDRYSRLETWTRKRFPEAQEITHRWSGQIVEPMDGLAFLGHNPLDKNNVYVITGDSGNGMTSCTVGALLITDQILGRPNEWEKLYHPSRISLSASGTFLKENANVAAQYLDWFKPGQAENVDELKRGEGKVIREGVKIIAAYKDDYGQVETLSAVCPHLGGIVRWNSAEKSWDCPCHGSRFDCHGKVLEGPAVSNLKPIDEDDHTLTGLTIKPLASDSDLKLDSV